MSSSSQKPFLVTGQATDRGMPEPVEIDSVTIRVDDGPPIEATLTQVPHQQLTTVKFAASAQVAGGAGPHTVTVTATNNQKHLCIENSLGARGIAELLLPAVGPDTQNR